MARAERAEVVLEALPDGFELASITDEHGQRYELRKHGQVIVAMNTVAEVAIVLAQAGIVRGDPDEA